MAVQHKEKREFALVSGRRLSYEQARVHKEASEKIGESYGIPKTDTGKLAALADSLIGFLNEKYASTETKVKAVDRLAELVGAAPFKQKQRERIQEKLEAAVRKDGGIEVWSSYAGFERALKERLALEASQAPIAGFEPKKK